MIENDKLEYNYATVEATKLELFANQRRDPACETLLKVLCFYKGLAALVCHRATRRSSGKNVIGGGDDNDGNTTTITKNGKLTCLGSL